jgi:hypothetical protein
MLEDIRVGPERTSPPSAIRLSSNVLTDFQGSLRTVQYCTGGVKASLMDIFVSKWRPNAHSGSLGLHGSAWERGETKSGNSATLMFAGAGS